MKTKNKSNIGRLATMLGLGSVTSVPLAALAGLFKIENAPMLAVALMAGPGAILTACLLDGDARSRMFAALLAGIIATLLVIVAAALGPRLLTLINLNLVKVAGAISIFSISLLILGIKLPENSPLLIIVLGILAGIIWR